MVIEWYMLQPPLNQNIQLHKIPQPTDFSDPMKLLYITDIKHSLLCIVENEVVEVFLNTTPPPILLRNCLCGSVIPQWHLFYVLLALLMQRI